MGTNSQLLCYPSAILHNPVRSMPRQPIPGAGAAVPAPSGAAAPDQVSLRILVPAFMISELKRAFEIGFLLFLPFLIIDLVVASVLMSMGIDDAAAGRGVAAVQADLLHAGRRLELGRGEFGAELWGG
jgi:hypothetical protein